MSWGLSPWGLAPWGIGDETDFYITNVFALSTLVVRVSVSRPALAQSASGVGDALNPNTWAIVDEKGGVHTVLAVSDTGQGTEFDLYVLQQLASYGVVHTLAAPTLKDVLGAYATVDELDFEGLAVDPRPKATPLAIYDIANNQFGGESPTFAIGTDGDYQKVYGPALLRKLITRRITTALGEFTHLPNYGLGVKLKEPMTVPRMATLKRDIDRDLLKEAEIEQAVASIRFSGSVLQIIVSAKVYGNNVEVREEIRTDVNL